MLLVLLCIFVKQVFGACNSPGPNYQLYNGRYYFGSTAEVSWDAAKAACAADGAQLAHTKTLADYEVVNNTFGKEMLLKQGLIY